MTIEIRKPEIERMMQEEILSGHFANVDDLLLEALQALRERHAAPSSGSSRNLPADEWMSKYRAWAYSHPIGAPLLSDEAIGRESIYRDRGL